VGQLPWRPVREFLLQILGQVNEPSITVPAEVPLRLLETGRAVAEVVFGAASVLLIAFFWISERLVIRRAILRLLAPERRERGLQIWEDVENKLGDWVRGQLILMGVTGIAFAIGLTGLGVKYAVLLAVFAGLMQLVPMVGPGIGTAPAVLVALTQRPELALFTLGLGLVVHVIVGNVLLPRVMRSTTGVSPLTVILGILIGAKLMGVPGALLAVPVAAGVQVLLTDLGVFEDRAPSRDIPILDVPGEQTATLPPPMEAEQVA
jgi:predicted PurR-regulated permease PerM